MSCDPFGWEAEEHFKPAPELSTKKPSVHFEALKLFPPLSGKAGAWLGRERRAETAFKRPSIPNAEPANVFCRVINCAVFSFIFAYWFVFKGITMLASNSLLVLHSQSSMVLLKFQHFIAFSHTFLPQFVFSCLTLTNQFDQKVWEKQGKSI